MELWGLLTPRCLGLQGRSQKFVIGLWGSLNNGEVSIQLAQKLGYLLTLLFI